LFQLCPTIPAAFSAVEQLVRRFGLPKVSMNRRIKSGGDEHMGRDKPGPDV
jgi:hypothetical protein